MNRRSAIKNLAITSGAIISLPSWMISCGISDKDTHHSSFNTKEQKLLAAVADTIIPAGTSFGALAVGVDKFLQKLIDDCCDAPLKEQLKKKLHELDESALSTNDADFDACSQQQRESLLLKFAPVADKEDENDFFTLMKRETIRGFSTSQKVMEEFHGYKIAPGFYHGCVSV